MTLPGVRINELDNQLGAVSSASGGKMFAIAGPSSTGPVNVPGTFARSKDIVAAYGGGPLVEAAAYWIEKYQRPVMLVRTAVTGDAAVSTVDHEATGTTVVTVGDDPTTPDDYELALHFLKGGTVGQAGITYRVSYDAGRTWSGAMSLGTATEITYPGTGVTFELAAGTVVAGDVHTATATAPQWNGTNLQAALAPLGVTTVPWEYVLLVGGVIDSTTFDVAEAVTTYGNGRHCWYGNTRLPNAGETEAAYAAALAPLSAAKASKHPSVAAGATKLTSAISGRAYRRPLAWSAATRQASVDEHINVAAVDLGPLPGVSIRAENGNPDEHDEAISPGLDDLRYVTARTHPRKPGVYITLPRVFAPPGSDFKIAPNRRVINLAYEALDDYLLGIVHKPIIVSRKTGFILPSVAKDIELGADAVLAAVLLNAPKASGAFFKMSRTDNLLSVPALTCGAKVLPLAYPEWIDLDLSFENPALNIQAV